MHSVVSSASSGPAPFQARERPRQSLPTTRPLRTAAAAAAAEDTYGGGWEAGGYESHGIVKGGKCMAGDIFESHGMGGKCMAGDIFASSSHLEQTVA